MTNIPFPDYETAMERIMHVTECDTREALAEFFGLNPRSIDEARKRQSIPDSWLLRILRATGTHPDWILEGKGEQRARPVEYMEAAAFPPVYVLDIQPPHSCTTEELATEIVKRALKSIDQAKQLRALSTAGPRDR